MEAIHTLIQTLHTYGLMNAEIAHYLGVSPSTITLIYQGKRSGEKYRQKFLQLSQIL